MKSLKQLQNWKSAKDLYNHCKRVVEEKENYAKTRVQQARELIKEYLNSGTILIE